MPIILNIGVKGQIVKLWTWQKDGFDITNASIPVDSKNNSRYWNVPIEETRAHFHRVYAKLWEKLETDQFHWYYCDENDAKSELSSEEYGTNAFLWELEIPEEKIWKIACSAAWESLRGCTLHAPRFFSLSWQHKLMKEDSKGLSEGKLDEFQSNFVNFWKRKNESELWDSLFLKEIVPFCSQVLLEHPVDSRFVNRNPLTEGKWWSLIKDKCPVDKNIQPLPCLRCPGANS